MAIPILCSIAFFSFAPNFDLKASMERGKKIYQAQCMSCHMDQGQGMPPVNPPLANANNLGDKTKLVKIILKGQRGLIKVNGVEYNGAMIGFALSDQQVADVINYMRNAWGNKGETILPSQIQPALKAKTKDYEPF